MASDSTQATELRREALSAEDVGLTPSQTSAPGWRRVRCGKGWRYLNARGAPLGAAARKRCESLVIPPAWQSVWINPDARGHIQAFGEDAAGRRQYIYHPQWRAAFDEAKFTDLLPFARRLPRLRSRTNRILSSSDDEFDRAVALLVRLLDVAGLRIGHRRYRDRSGAIGATTLKTRHVDCQDGHVRLSFPAKSGQHMIVDIDDPDLVEGLASYCTTPGRDLFDLASGRVRASDVNAYIEDAMGPGFTAKNFRTWGGSVAAAHALRCDPDKGAKAVVEAAAKWLGNTPTVARGSYIHPAILELAEGDATPPAPSGPARLRADERFCFGIIEAYET